MGSTSSSTTTSRPAAGSSSRRSPQARGRRGRRSRCRYLAEAIGGCDVVFHFAANADVRYGLEDPNRDLAQNLLATFTVLEAMRTAGVKRIVFASTASVYGEPDVVPTPEDVSVPGPDLALRGVEARGGRAHPGLLRGLRLQRRHLALRLGARRALHARSPVRLLRRAEARTRGR